VTDDRRERAILLVTSTAHFLTHFAMLVFPSLALAIRGDWAMPLSDVLGLGFWMYLLYGLGALPFGLLTDATGRPRTMLALCLAGIGLFSLLAARAATPAQLRLALAGIGLATSIYHPAGIAWISRAIRQRGRALGLNGVAGNLGVVTAPLTAGVLAVSLGWRAAYALMGVVSLAAAVWALRLPLGRDPVDEPAAAPAVAARRQGVAFAALCVAMALGGLAYRGQTLVLPAWIEQRLAELVHLVGEWHGLPWAGTTLVAATLLTSGAYLAGAAGQVVGGRLADRCDLRLLYAAFHAATIPLLWLVGRLSGWPLLAAAFVYAFFAFGMQPAENSLVAFLTPPRLRSTGYGLKFVLVFGVGSLAVRLVQRWQPVVGTGGVFPRLAVVEAGLLVFVGVLWLLTRRRIVRNSG